MTFLALLLALYFLPTLNAVCKGHLDWGSIFVINLFFGWTGLGWLFALAWSASGNTKRNRRLP